MTTIKLCPYHRFYLLTKQPQNLIKFSPFPDNCWVGVTATNKLMYADALHHLSKIAAGKIYLSFEPLLSWDDCLPKADGGIMLDSQIDWLIIGAQTKPYKPPEISWVTEIVEAADKADIPIFLKNNLSPLISGCLECVGACSKQFKIENLLLDEEYKLRQELPAR